MVQDSVSLLPNTDAPTIHVVPPRCDRTVCPRYPTLLLCRESPIRGGNIYNGNKIPVHWIYVLKHCMPLSKGRCTDVSLYILCLVEEIHQGRDV